MYKSFTIYAHFFNQGGSFALKNLQVQGLLTLLNVRLEVKSVAKSIFAHMLQNGILLDGHSFLPCNIIMQAERKKQGRDFARAKSTTWEKRCCDS